MIPPANCVVVMIAKILETQLRMFALLILLYLQKTTGTAVAVPSHDREEIYRVFDFLSI